MLVVWILSAIIIFIALIFSLKLKLYIKVDDGTTVRAGIGPYIKTVSPKKKKKIKISDFSYKKHLKRLKKEKKVKDKKTAKKEKKSKSQKLKNKIDENTQVQENGSAEEKLFSLIDIISFILEEFPKLASYIQIRIKTLHITIGGNDSAKIAETYGVVQALTALLIELLENKTDFTSIKEGDVTVCADFLSDKTKFELDMAMKLRIFSIVKVIFHSLMWFIKAKIKQEKRA